MRNSLSKIALAVFAVNSALSMAFAGIPANCAEEIITLSKSSDFDMKKFTNNLPLAVGKAKLQAKAPFGQPKDSDKTDIGITFGCLKVFPESPSEITSLLEDVSKKTASGTVAVAPVLQPQYAQPQYVQPQYEQPQYIQPQYVQPQVQYVYLPQPCPQCPQCPQYSPNQQEEYQKRLTENADRQERYINIQWLINDGIEKNKKEIQEESLYLSPYEVQSLYNINKKRAAIGWAALGGSVGLGLGSYIQGNITFGIVQSVVDLISVLLLTSNNTAIIAPYTLSISRVTGLISPFIYQNNYNKTLAEALNNHSLYYSYSIDPLIVPKDGGAPAVGLAFNLRY